MQTGGLCAQAKVQAGSNGFFRSKFRLEVRLELLVTGNIIQRLNQGAVSKIKTMGLACLGLMAGSAKTVLGRESAAQIASGEAAVRITQG